MKKTCKKLFAGIFCITFAAVSLLFLGCDKNKIQYEFGNTGSPAPYPNVSFAVMSDIHLYDPALGSSGSAFEAILNSDRKLLLDSIDLLDFAINTIIAEKPFFVLIPGDLTKDGELNNHRIVAEQLKRLKNAGINVYVVPGNHDVNNPGAEQYSGDTVTHIPTISAEDFESIYRDFGYEKTVMRDDDSLSYVVEPVEGLWLLALDACRYRENEPGKGEIVSGKISQRTADWIALVLRAAHNNSKTVMAMMHHGIVEHWDEQSKLHRGFLINDYVNFGRFLASWNVRLTFTGHYHAQDITLGEFEDKYILDIETGSLVTAPSPMRFVTIRDNTLNIRTETIIDKIHPGTDFAANSHIFVKKTLMNEAIAILKKYFVSAKDAEYIANAVGDAFVAHYAGDENPALRPGFDTINMNLWGRFAYSLEKYVFDGLWVDLAPEDNNLSFKL